MKFHMTRLIKQIVSTTKKSTEKLHHFDLDRFKRNVYTEVKLGFLVG